MLEELRKRLNGKRTVVLGIGNPLRGDDGVGSQLALRLQGKVNALVVDAGEVPENYLGPIVAARPEAVVIVDAAELGAAPGTIAIIEADALDGASLSTHNASLSLFVKVLCAEIQPDVFLLGVQPASSAFGAAMSQPVERALGILEELLRNSLPAP